MDSILSVHTSKIREVSVMKDYYLFASNEAMKDRERMDKEMSQSERQQFSSKTLKVDGNILIIERVQSKEDTLRAQKYNQAFLDRLIKREEQFEDKTQK